MENRPVIILGSGLWGSLLAYRLTQCLPQVNFKLYTTSTTFGEGNSWLFRESELMATGLDWIRPFISYGWRGQRLTTSGTERILKTPCSLVLPGQFENLVRRIPSEKLGSHITIEELLNRSSFIIDTRPDPRQKTKCYRHTLGLLVELQNPHELDLPVTLDATVKQSGIFRHMQYLPLNPHTILVKDVRYCKEASFQVEEREEELLWEIRKRWKIKDVLHQETESVIIPSGRIRPWNHGRVIGLGGILNPVTGDQFAEAVRVIDLMVKTSFRLGELKEAIGSYRQSQEQSKRLSRLFVKMIYHSQHRHQLLDQLFRLPLPGLEKFLNGTLGLTDIGKALFLRPSLPLVRALGSLLSNKSTEMEDLTVKGV